jgi:putative copper resistance protein D
MANALVLCRFVHFAMVLMLFGAWFFRPLLLNRVNTIDQRLSPITRWLTLVALVSGVGWLLLVTASMAGAWDAGFDSSTLQLVLGKTSFGQVWCWHLLFNALLLALLFTALKDRPAPRLLLGGLLVATLAPVGHGAMLDGTAGQLLLLNQLIHLLCASAWLGGLMLLVMVLRRPEGHSIRAVLQRFSGLGYGLVGGLLLTGMANVRVLTGTFWPTPLFSGFALILLIKAALVAVMLGLALFNRLRIGDCERRLGAVRLSVTLEWLLGLGAVAAVSLLGTLPPMLSS